jgi:hypothetical protein
VKWAALVMAVAVLGLTALVVAQGYVGRAALRTSQLAGCERGKLDRAANAKGWRAAEAARRRSGTASDLRTAKLYAGIASGLEMRSRVVCETAFPAPRLIGK